MRGEEGNSPGDVASEREILTSLGMHYLQRNLLFYIYIFYFFYIFCIFSLGGGVHTICLSVCSFLSFFLRGEIFLNLLLVFLLGIFIEVT